MKISIDNSVIFEILSIQMAGTNLHIKYFRWKHNMQTEAIDSTSDKQSIVYSLLWKYS
jgi:hypothetical protein